MAETVVWKTKEYVDFKKDNFHTQQPNEGGDGTQCLCLIRQQSDLRGEPVQCIITESDM